MHHDSQRKLTYDAPYSTEYQLLHGLRSDASPVQNLLGVSLLSVIHPIPHSAKLLKEELGKSVNCRSIIKRLGEVAYAFTRNTNGLVMTAITAAILE